MSEQDKKPETKIKSGKEKVMTKRNIWVDVGGKTKKVKAGEVVELSKDDIKHFGGAVTKDFSEDED